MNPEQDGDGAMRRLRAAALEAFGDEAGVETWVWAPNGKLDGLTPFRAVMSGRLRDAVKALGADAGRGCESPARMKREEMGRRGRAAGRKWFDLLERLAFACPLHDFTHDLDSAGRSYEDEVEACKDMVRRPSERECLEALKGLAATCREYDPAAGGCDDGWRDADIAERNCLAPFGELLRKAEIEAADAMKCETCGGHPDDDWDEWGCHVCGGEYCVKCTAFHVCAEEKRDQRDIELGRENADRCGKGD